MGTAGAVRARDRTWRWRAPALRVLPVDGVAFAVAFSPDGTKLTAFDSSWPRDRSGRPAGALGCDRHPPLLARRREGTNWRAPGSDWDTVSNTTAIDPSGRWGATSSDYTRRGARKTIRVWDLDSGAVVREWPQAPEGESVEGEAWASVDVDFLRDGRLVPTW